MWRSLIISFALQTMAVTVGVVASILTVDKLGSFALPQPMPPAPRAHKAIQVIAVKPYSSIVPSSAVHVPARPFVAPSRIPVGIPVLHDAADMQLAQAPSLASCETNCAPGGIGSPGMLPISEQLPKSIAPPPAPARNTPPTKTVIRVGGSVLEAKLTKRVLPVYPPLARQMRLSGTVRLEGVIARDGRVVNLQVVSGHPMLAEAALQAVRQWVYSPTLLNGEPVEVIAPIDVNFTLSR